MLKLYEILELLPCYDGKLWPNEDDWESDIKKEGDVVR
jgi:hypothetical protein